MSRLSVPALIATVAALIGTTSCSPAGSPKAASASASTTATHFQRLGYSLVVPSGWTSKEGYLDWGQVGGPPRIGAPAFDDVLSPSEDPRMLIGSQPVTDAAPLDEWIADVTASGEITYPPQDCNPPEDTTTASLGGEAAQLLAFHCPTDGPKAAIVQVLARHADSGWVVNCFSGSGVAGGLHGLEQQCRRWLTSFRFTS